MTVKQISNQRNKSWWVKLRAATNLIWYQTYHALSCTILKNRGHRKQAVIDERFWFMSFGYMRVEMVWCCQIFESRVCFPRERDWNHVQFNPPHATNMCIGWIRINLSSKAAQMAKLQPIKPWTFTQSQAHKLVFEWVSNSNYCGHAE